VEVRLSSASPDTITFFAALLCGRDRSDRKCRTPPSGYPWPTRRQSWFLHSYCSHLLYVPVPKTRIFCGPHPIELAYQSINRGGVLPLSSKFSCTGFRPSVAASIDGCASLASPAPCLPLAGSQYVLQAVRQLDSSIMVFAQGRPMADADKCNRRAPSLRIEAFLGNNIERARCFI